MYVHIYIYTYFYIYIYLYIYIFIYIFIYTYMYIYIYIYLYMYLYINNLSSRECKNKWTIVCLTCNLLTLPMMCVCVCVFVCMCVCVWAAGWAHTLWTRRHWQPTDTPQKTTISPFLCSSGGHVTLVTWLWWRDSGHVTHVTLVTWVWWRDSGHVTHDFLFVKVWRFATQFVSLDSWLRKQGHNSCCRNTHTHTHTHSHSLTHTLTHSHTHTNETTNEDVKRLLPKQGSGRVGRRLHRGSRDTEVGSDPRGPVGVEESATCGRTQVLRLWRPL